MKRRFFAFVIALVFGSSAQAQVGAWDGYYVGILGSTSNMSVEDLTFGTGAFEPSGMSYGGFTGMNRQVNSLVYGLEATLEASNISGNDGANMAPFSVNTSVSLRGRLGVDAGRALPYLMAGYVASSFEADHAGNGSAADIANFSASGITYGIGVDLHLNRQNNRFLRLELQMIDYSDGSMPFYSGSDNHAIASSSQSFSVGYGISF